MVGFVHPRAVIESGADISPEAEIGAFSYIGSDVCLGRVKVGAHVVIEGRTRIGDGTVVSPFACLGGFPQIKGLGFSDGGELLIGERCVIREYVTINVGSAGGGGRTVIGDDCLLMIGCHIAHDCVIGEHVILANHVDLAGHVSVGHHANIGGLCGVHQWVRIGEYAMLGFSTAVEQDVIPYGFVSGERGSLRSFNWRRMKSIGFSRSDLHAASLLFDELFKGVGDLRTRAHDLLDDSRYRDNDFVRVVLDFVLSDSKREITTWKKR